MLYTQLRNEEVVGWLRLPGGRKLLLSDRSIIAFRSRQATKIPLEGVTKYRTEFNRGVLVAYLIREGSVLMEIVIGKRKRTCLG